MSGPDKSLEVDKAREKETDLLDEIEPELLRSLPESFQRFLELWRKVRAEKDRRRAEP